MRDNCGAVIELRVPDGSWFAVEPSRHPELSLLSHGPAALENRFYLGDLGKMT
jgi:hypothetical protein